MRQNISVINNPIIDILIAVASWGGVENCINMVGKYLCEKGFRVRVIQMVYEGMYWVMIVWNFIISVPQEMTMIFVILLMDTHHF